jgi:hypothetical protein
MARNLIVELRNTRAAIATSADAPHYNGYLKVVRNDSGEKYGLAREASIGEIGLFVSFLVIVVQVEVGTQRPEKLLGSLGERLTAG